MSLLSSLGFKFNYAKSQLKATQNCKFLGFIFNSLSQSITISPKRRAALFRMTLHYASRPRYRIRDFASMIGFLVSICPAVQYGLLYTKEFARRKFLTLVGANRNYAVKMEISTHLAKNFRWWIKISIQHPRLMSLVRQIHCNKLIIKVPYQIKTSGPGSDARNHSSLFDRLQWTHLVKNVKPSRANRILLLLDNHDSHLSINALNYAKENGIIMLSFPPHCSYKMQPLDVSVYDPLKKFLSTAQDSWILNQPGKTISIYDIPSIVRNVLPLALTPSNIMAGFRVSIYPLNPNAFTDMDFAPSYVTDRVEAPQHENIVAVSNVNAIHYIYISYKNYLNRLFFSKFI
ncbi:hypothetical protein ALC57_10394 [Trachymyrmex cornetzi]|uniref:DDE-1 domain-containing protein n=1 Tax=Trachymyrmex cornetzi TaxID=471704 RepID=A0A151J469_9HYME|nr:hypothetical protein ALC57_10394 [Trachymyrmex cornetzi]